MLNLVGRKCLFRTTMNAIPIDFSLSNQAWLLSVPILLTLVGFSVFWFISKDSGIKRRFYEESDTNLDNTNHIFFTKVVGFLSMGLIPLVIMLILFPNTDLAYYGFTIIPETSMLSLLWIVLLSIAVIPLAYFSAKKPKNLLNYPQIRAREWSRRTFYLNLFGWFIYLVGYEVLFRGTLLFPIYQLVGLWPAIAINVALYAATHIPKGIEETIGAVPLGIVLCILTLQTGTLWIAIFVHVALAWTNSLTALKFHPDIHYKSRKKDV